MGIEALKRTEKEHLYKNLLERTRRRLKSSYSEFFKFFWPEVSGERLVLNWHIGLVCRTLQYYGLKVIQREKKDADIIINIPPGMSKSTMVTELWPVWLWINDPTLQICSCSYDLRLAMRQATKSRDVIRSDRFQELFGNEVVIPRGEDSKQFYKNASGGFRFAASIGTNVTGTHFHIIIKDDLVNPKGVLSSAVLETVKEFQKALSSRCVNKAITLEVNVQQRLHEEDPTGYILDLSKKHNLPVIHICLPATDDYHVKPSKLRKFYKDGLLDPVRLNREDLRKQKALLGSKDYAGQYGQSPRPLDGNMVLKNWLRVVPEHKLPPEMIERNVRDIVVDTAYKEKQQNDPSAFLSYSIHNGALYIFSFRKGRWAFPDLIRNLKMFAREQGETNSRIYVEPKASGVSLVQMLQDEWELNVIEWDMPSGDKVERLNSVLPFLEAGRVFLVDGIWNGDFIGECLLFPNGKHDEAVDLLVMACVNAFVRKKSSGYTFWQVGT